MCKSCWIEHGSPTILPPNAAAILTDIRELYRHYPTGGYLHAELDDWNIEDGFWRPDFEGTASWADKGMTDADVAAAHTVIRRVAEAMAALSETERAAVLATYEGFIL